jgi:hypothetical protein
LHLDHVFQENSTTFDGIHEMQLAPPRVEMDDIIRWGNMRKHFLRQGGHPQSNDLAKMYGIKHVPSFFELEYWKV